MICLAIDIDGSSQELALGIGFESLHAAPIALLLTHIAATTATLFRMFIKWVRFGLLLLDGIVTGLLIGLATVTPASGLIGVPGRLILGLAGGVA